MKKYFLVFLLSAILLFVLPLCFFAQTDYIYAYAGKTVSVPTAGEMTYDPSMFSIVSSDESSTVLSVASSADKGLYTVSGTQTFCIAVLDQAFAGDANMDGQLTTTDARKILRAVVGSEDLDECGSENTLLVGGFTTSSARKVLVSALSDSPAKSVEAYFEPFKTSYGVSEDVDPSGARILVNYENGKKELLPVTASMISDFSSTTTGRKSYTAAVGNQTAQFMFSVANVTFADGANTYGKNFNYLCGLDMYGRAVQPVSGFDGSKDVGIFYFLAAGIGSNTTSGAASGTYDITEIIAAGKEDDLLNSPYMYNQYLFWGKPLFGYYRSGDQWVFKRHIEMLSAAGVDYVLFDVTNCLIYSQECNLYLAALLQYREEGWDVPKFAFYTHNSTETMDTLYSFYYGNASSLALYGDLVYAPKGKPLIIGDNPSETVAANMDVRPAYWPQQAMDGNFSQHDYEGFPWIEWVFEPYMHDNSTICVSVAQHRNGAFSFSPVSDIESHIPNWGRGYDADGNRNADSYGLGQNFLRQWDIAIEKGAQNVFITGWNEWTAMKLGPHEEVTYATYFICDQYNAEFSRDIEPMTGGFEDSYYLQLIDQIRRFKGVTSDFEQTTGRTIDVSNTADLSAWDTVESVYDNVQYASYNRRTNLAYSMKMPTTERWLYRASAPLNNITQVKITHDSQNVYFLISASENILSNSSTSYTDADRWMNILLSTGEVKTQGWEGYKYVINRTADTITSGQSGVGSINLLNEDGTTGEEVGQAQISLSGKNLQVAIPLSVIDADCAAQGFYFKVADNILYNTDIMNYYITGKSFPMGRLSYYYYF